MKCRHCKREIREVFCDPSMPYVHDETGASFCDIRNLNDVFSNKWKAVRSEAEPQEYEGEFTGVMDVKFSLN